MPFKVLTAEFMHESNTFSIRKTGIPEFQRETLMFGDEAIAKRSQSNTGLAGALVCQREFGWDMRHSVSAWTEPSGPVTVEAYEYLTGKIIGEDPVTKEPIRTVVATAVGFDVATVLDMPIDSAFDKIPVAGAPTTNFEDHGVKLFSGRDDKLSDSSNMVRLAGIIAATRFRAPHPDKGIRARCEVLLRQKEDGSQLIPVRY